MNHGLLLKPIEPDHFIFGDGKLGDLPVNPGGQWDAWLPVAEDQAPFGFEPMACTTFALLNAVEIMLRQKYGATNNLCKKFLAYVSGTTTSGNDPHTVAEALRTKGDCDELDYPYVSTDNTWAKFYAAPAKWLYVKALEFVAQYSFGHSWVTPVSVGSMMSALDYSPLTVGVYAWLQEDTTGYYTNKQNLPPEHDVCIYGYVVNEYWKCFDSYSLETKKLAWDMPFSGVKRYTLNRQIVNPSGWDNFLYWIGQVIDQMKASMNIGDFREFGGVPRSPEWPAVRAKHLLKEPFCQVCGGKTKLNVHHIRPYHLHPELELDDTNLITLCTGSSNTINCHVRFGHWDNFKDKYNPKIRQEAPVWYARFMSKVEDETL